MQISLPINTFSVVNKPYINTNNDAVHFGQKRDASKKIRAFFVANPSQEAQVHRWTNAERLLAAVKGSSDVKIMQSLDEADIMPSEAVKFLKEITADETLSKRFIDEIIKDEKGNFDPKKSPEIVRKLVKKTGGKENFEDWYFGNKGYLSAFSRYTKDFYKNAKSVQELYDFSPAWGSWALRQKFVELKEAEGEEISIMENVDPEGRWQRQIYTDAYSVGTLPREFENTETARNFIEELRGNSRDEEALNEVARKYGFKSATLLDRGYSGKLNINLDDKYVIKASGYRDRSRDASYYNDCMDMTPDSVLLNSLVDYYTNRYAENAASKLYYYDNLANFSIYCFEKGEPVSFETDKAEINTKNRFFKELFQNVEDIGISYTDYNSKNYIKTKDGIKCIDCGHAVYSDILKPQTGSLMISLPCRTGLNPLEIEGRLSSILS